MLRFRYSIFISAIFLILLIPTTLAAQAPSLSSISPTALSPGMQVTLTGSGFGVSQGSGRVSVGPQAYGTVVSWTNTQVIITVPSAGLQPGSIAVEQNALWSNGIAFTVIPPTLTSISATSLSPGMQVTLTGSGFGASQGSGAVTVGPQAHGTIVSWSNTQIVITVPSTGLQPGNIAVWQYQVWSNAVAFTVIPPTLTSISATSLSPGMQVALTGSGFGASQGSGAVTVGPEAHGTIVSWSNTQIVITVPSTGLQPGNIAVWQYQVWSNAVAFTVIPPTLTSISLTAFSPGMRVTLTGSGFGASQGSGAVAVGPEAHGTIVSWSNTQIVITVPSAGLQPGNITVWQYQVWSNAVAFTVTPAPSIVNLSPTSGVAGAIVTVNGSNLGNGQSATVTFNGVAATPTDWTNTSITVPVPSSATSGNVLVTIGGLASNGNSFTVVPNITGITPATGAISALVTITGTSFGASPGTVTFNGTTASPTSWSAGSIVVPVPSGATTGNVVVVAGGATSAGMSFTVLPSPTISSLNPSAATAGTVVQILGQNLSVAGQLPVVNIGNLQITGTQVSSSDPTSVFFLVPQGAASGALTVQLAGQSSNSVPFTLLTPPQIYTLAPLEVVPSGVLTISGIYFGTSGASGNSLLLDGQTSTGSSWTSTQITLQVPSASGVHTVAVVSGGAQSETLEFTVLAYGSISGTVTANGLPVSGATVQGAAGQSAVTDNGGNFSFPVVPIGNYSLGATAIGYVPTMVSAVAVTNGANSITQLQLSLSNPTQLNIVPNGPTIVVGAGQNLSLVDQNGMPVTGATWSVDDSTIAFLDATDNSIVGVAAGSTTVRASWQGLQASAAVNVIGPGITLWSTQLRGQQAPALPLAKTGTGPDLVYTDGANNIYGLSYDNGVLWQQVATNAYDFSRAAADENGDFVVPSPPDSNTMTKFFGSNGLPEWTRTLPFPSFFSSFAVDSNGNVFVVVDPDDYSKPMTLREYSSTSGQVILSQALAPNEPLAGQVSILSDGSAQVQYTLNSSVTHLATLTANSASDDVLGGLRTSLLANLPDGDGGTVNVWDDFSDPSLGNIIFNDSATGTTFQSNNAGTSPELANWVLGSTGILYFLAQENSSFEFVLVAMNLASGQEAWRIPVVSLSWTGQHTPVAATNDGGLVVVDNDWSTGAPTAAFRVDTSGNVTPDPNLTAYLGTANSAFSPLTYLGGPDGTLWASSTSGAVVSDSADVQISSGLPVSAWQAPVGQRNAYRAARSAHWLDADTDRYTNAQGQGKYKDCGGFDDKAPAILVVPQSTSNQSGTNTVQLRVDGRNAWRTVTLQSDTPSVTFTPSAPIASTTVFTITGGPNPVLARIKAINSNGTNLATLRVAVKAPPQLNTPGVTLDPTTLNATLDLYPVMEPVDNLVPIVPTTASVLSELQQTFGKHTNIPFAVNLMPQISIHYDLNGDRLLAYTGQDPSSNAEGLTINTYLFRNNANQSHYYAAYVNGIASTTHVEGFGSLPLMFIQNQTGSGQAYVTAHELGHALCVNKKTQTCLSHSADEKDVMIEPDPGWAPCRLHAEEWNILNPTGSSTGVPAQWELAPPQPEDR